MTASGDPARWTVDDDGRLRFSRDGLSEAFNRNQLGYLPADWWDALVADIAAARVHEGCTHTTDTLRQAREPDSIERLAEAVHQAYLDTCERLGWPVKPANQVPYAELPEDSKELDRASVRAVLDLLAAEGPDHE